MNGEQGHRSTQTSRIVELLRSRRGAWVALPEILSLNVAQYNARIHQARHEWGLTIENRTEVRDGIRQSWFRLLEPHPPVAHLTNLSGDTLPLFGGNQ